MGANRFRNPDEDLPTDFEQKREAYYEALHQPREADVFVNTVKAAMQQALRSLDGALPPISSSVKILPGRKKAIRRS